MGIQFIKQGLLLEENTFTYERSTRKYRWLRLHVHYRSLAIRLRFSFGRDARRVAGESSDSESGVINSRRNRICPFIARALLGFINIR